MNDTGYPKLVLCGQPGETGCGGTRGEVQDVGDTCIPMADLY